MLHSVEEDGTGNPYAACNAMPSKGEAGEGHTAFAECFEELLLKAFNVWKHMSAEMC